MMNADLSVIESNFNEDNSYPADFLNVNLGGVDREIELAKSLYSRTFEFYAYSNEQRGFLENCMMGNLYNNFKLYGEYLSSYKVCMTNPCENINQLVTKISLVKSDIEDAVKVCRSELSELN
jgi:hypothetical protein